MALGETLVNLRKKKGLSQEQLAEKLNLTRQTISKWELNQSAPDIAYLLQLSDFFEVSTDYLIKGETQKSNSNDSQHSEIVTVTTSQSEDKAYKWCVIIGAIFIVISALGIIAFLVSSALNPWTAQVGNHIYDGILGFLIGTKTSWCFILLLVFFVAGCYASIYGIVKSIRKKQ